MRWVSLALLASAQAIAGGNVGLVLNNASPIDLALSQSVELRLNSPRRVRLQTTQPLLCTDFNTSTSPVGLELFDPNGVNSGVFRGGITNIDYFTNGTQRAALKVTAPSASLACCLMRPNAAAFCFQGPIMASAGGGSTAPEVIFKSSFETPQRVMVAGKSVLATVDVEVTVNSSQATRRAGETWTYTVLVRNIGTTNVTSVRVRDWFARAPNFSPAFSNGNWTCTAATGAVCGTSSGSGNISASAVSLNAGASVTFTVNRPVVSSPAPAVGSTAWASAAVFAPPTAAEAVLGNNQSAKMLTIAQ
jgi:uncharacterized repeat protein (TIGR01451 family)